MPLSSQTNMDDASAAKKAKYSQINGDDGFQQRSSAVFSCLDRLEPARESEPQRTGRRFPRQVPDHVVHPEKWTKYSLEDDGTSGLQGATGDAANRNIALSFLDDLRKRRASESNHESASRGPTAEARDGKPVFSAKSKVEAAKATKLCAERQSRVKDGVNVMPEHVVGKTPKKGSVAPARVQRAADGSRSAEPRQAVGLEHLLDERDELEEPSMQAEEHLGGVAEGKVVFTKRKSRRNREMRPREVEAAEAAGSDSV